METIVEEPKVDPNEAKKTEFITELRNLHAVHSKQRWSLLLRYADWFAELEDDFFSALVHICSKNKYITEEEMLKARLVGRKEMPVAVAKNPVVTAEWYEKLPDSEKTKLSNPNSKIIVKKGNTITTIKAKDFDELRPEETKRIININHPEVGLMNPNNAPVSFPKSERPKVFYDIAEMDFGDDGVFQIKLKNAAGFTFTGQKQFQKDSLEQKELFKKILAFFI
jgi:hypothetical protein